ncbi:MAG: UDP-2,3-diacylglucosamine diphosphatase [Wenzhouxiangellaceae bacterium]
MSSARHGCLFLSDLHLQDPAEPAARWFAEVLDQARQRVAQIFILGDLFEAWIGDDAPGAVGDWVAAQLAPLAGDGIALYFMHGNRDFLVGEDYARRCGMRLLPGPVQIMLRQGPCLILHGDELCTDDQRYQAFRQQVRQDAWQQAFLDQPVSERLRQASAARDASREHTRASTTEIMDVNEDAVRQMFDHHGVRQMIHGHTHRPALHRYADRHDERTRLVLGDWGEAPAPHWLDETASWQ